MVTPTSSVDIGSRISQAFILSENPENGQHAWHHFAKQSELRTASEADSLPAHYNLAAQDWLPAKTRATRTVDLPVHSKMGYITSSISLHR